MTLTSVPGTDTLTLGIPDGTVTGLARGICAELTVTVTGTSVAGTATYTVVVTREILDPVVETGS